MRYLRFSLAPLGAPVLARCRRLACMGLAVGMLFSGSVAAVASLGVASAAWAAASGFVDGFEDLPLMPGLSQDPGSATVFDSTAGRIIESYATGRLSQDSVLSFYAETLPQLGWEAVGVDHAAAIYRREGEDLRVDVREKGGIVNVHFQASPH